VGNLSRYSSADELMNEHWHASLGDTAFEKVVHCIQQMYIETRQFVDL